jgi:hypothetical protein
MKMEKVVYLFLKTIRTLIIAFSVFWLFGCARNEVGSVETIQPVQSATSVISPPTEEFLSSSTGTMIAQDMQTAVPVQAPGVTPVTPLYPVPGIELSSMDPASLDLVDQAGAYWVRRNSLKWSEVEPQEGQRNWDSQVKLENELQKASKRGLQVVLVVSSTPEWAQMVPGSFCGPVSADKLLAFARFFKDAVKRYSLAPYYVRYWEIWNEPDVAPNIVASDSVYGCWGDDTDAYYGGGYYAEMLKKVYPQVKAANPEAQVLVGGLLLDCDPVNPPVGEQCISAGYLEGIMRNGGGDYFDGVSFHAYDYYTGPFEYRNQNWNSYWDSTGPVIIAKARFVRSVLAAYHHPEKFILNTESGLLCGQSGNEPQCQVEDFALTKAYYIAQVNVVSFAESLRANIWYCLEGWRGTALVDAQGKPNSAYQAFQFSSAQLKESVFVRSITDYPGVKGYEYRREGKKVYFLWSLEKEPNPVSFDTVPDAVFDVFGQVLTSELSIEITQQPVYVEWNQ